VLEHLAEITAIDPAPAGRAADEVSFITAHDLAIDQAGPQLEEVHGLDHEREAGRPVVAPAGDQPNPDGI
jgi:hypothetical protein